MSLTKAEARVLRPCPEILEDVTEDTFTAGCSNGRNTDKAPALIRPVREQPRLPVREMVERAGDDEIRESVSLRAEQPELERRSGRSEIRLKPMIVKKQLTRSGNKLVLMTKGSCIC